MCRALTQATSINFDEFHPTQASDPCPVDMAGAAPTAMFVALGRASTRAVDRKRFVVKNGENNCFRVAVCKTEMDTLDISGCRRSTTWRRCSPFGSAAS